MAAVEDSLLAAFAGLFDCSFEAAPNAARHTIHRPQPLFEVGEGRSVAGVRLDAASGTDAFSTATSQPRGAVRLAG
jgi:hypothetical protein